MVGGVFVCSFTTFLIDADLILPLTMTFEPLAENFRLRFIWNEQEHNVSPRGSFRDRYYRKSISECSILIRIIAITYENLRDATIPQVFGLCRSFVSRGVE